MSPLNHNKSTINKMQKLKTDYIKWHQWRYEIMHKKKKTQSWWRIYPTIVICSSSNCFLTIWIFHPRSTQLQIQISWWQIYRIKITEFLKTILTYMAIKKIKIKAVKFQLKVIKKTTIKRAYLLEKCLNSKNQMTQQKINHYYAIQFWLRKPATPTISTIAW